MVVLLCVWLLTIRELDLAVEVVGVPLSTRVVGRASTLMGNFVRVCAVGLDRCDRPLVSLIRHVDRCVAHGFIESHDLPATPPSFQSVFAWGIEGGAPPCDAMASSSGGALGVPMEMAQLSYPSDRCSVSLFEAYGSVVKGWVLVNRSGIPTHITVHVIACKFQDTLSSATKL